MRIVRIAAAKWTVYAPCRPDGSCPLLEFIEGLPEKRRDKVLSDLQQFLPNSAPAVWAQMEFSTKLTDEIYEFRWPCRGGGTPRILWFFDEGRVVVCVNGEEKKGKLDKGLIPAAEAIRTLFLAARAAGRLDVVGIDDVE